MILRSRKPRAFSVPICVFSEAVSRCMVVTMVRMAMAKNSTGSTPAMVLPSFTSPCASLYETTSSLERMSVVVPSAASTAAVKSFFDRSEITLICV